MDDKEALVVVCLFFSSCCAVGVSYLCKALCFIRNFYKLQRYGVVSSGIVIGYSFYRKKTVNKHTVRYYKPVVRYTANGKVLEGKSDNARAIKPYEIGEAVKVKYLSNEPSYVKMPESILDTVAFNVAVFVPVLAFIFSLLGQLSADESRLVRYGLPIAIIGSLPVQAIRILASKANIFDEIMTTKILWQGALALLGVCAILLAINSVL
jgi:hypothetical protein